MVHYLERGASRVSVQMKRLSSDRLDFVVIMDGQEIRISHGVISLDGKTLTVKVNGPKADRLAQEELAVYEKR